MNNTVCPDIKAVLAKALPSCEKCFSDEKFDSKKEKNSFKMLKNQRLAFQVAYIKKTPELDGEIAAELVIDSPLKDYITLYSIEEVPNYKPCYDETDNDYLRKTSGLYPDLLMPASPRFHRIFSSRLRAFYVLIENADGIAPGTYPVAFEFYKDGDFLGGTEVTVEVVNAMLPKQKLIYTNWFHNDCLATYYGCDIYGERHWQIIENFVREAVSEGMNMILTPVLTPPLDTGKGWQRPDVGLVDIYKNGDDYTFEYANLDRWVQMCERCGIEYFEISHLFSQWSAANAPKVTAYVDGAKDKTEIFGWTTDAVSPEYTAFIRAFIKNLIEHLKTLGVDKKCFFHISDEPNTAVYDSYCASKNSVIDLFEGYPVIDALSDFEFYEKGQIAMPIPAITAAYPFLEQDLPMRWVYYCCAQHDKVSNRFLSMPGRRTEIIGVQLYKYAIDGFLQWGYNFYYSASSWHIINPFIDLSGDNWVPAGDTFVVYPAPDGTPYRSLHGMQFSEGLQDLRLLQFCESLIGRDATMALVNEGVDGEMTFHDYPRTDEYLLTLKDRVIDTIKENI